MSTTRRIALIGFLICGGWWSCLPNAAFAQGLQITPILIELMPGQMTTTLMVTNRGADATALQVRPFKWTQIGGIDQLTPTSELVISPPIIGIGLGQSQTFRILLRHTAVGAESSYRLLLDQLPPPGAPGTVRVALRFSIPVFAEASTRTESNLAWRISAGTDGDFLIAANRGGRHVRVINPVLSQQDGERLVGQQTTSPYILPGSEQRWQIHPKSQLQRDSAWHLVAISDAGPVDAVVHVTGP